MLSLLWLVLLCWCDCFVLFCCVRRDLVWRVACCFVYCVLCCYGVCRFVVLCAYDLCVCVVVVFVGMVGACCVIVCVVVWFSLFVLLCLCVFVI